MYLNKRSPANLGSYVPGFRSPANLGFFRPNQAYDRGIYGLGRIQPHPPLRMLTISGLGCDRCKRDARAALRGRDRRRGGLGDDTNFLPAGSQLTYAANWTAGFFYNTTGSNLAASIAAVLNSQWGIVIDGEKDTTGFFTNSPGFTLTLHTTKDYGTANDVKSILDGVLYQTGGQSIVSSSISVVALAKPGAAAAGGATSGAVAGTTAAISAQYQQAIAVGDTATANSLAQAYPDIVGVSSPFTTSSLFNTASSAAAALTSNPLGWLEQNWQWVALGAAGIFILPRFLK